MAAPLDNSPAPTAGGNPFQRTAEWLAERCGYLTASQAYPALTRAKRGGWLKGRGDLIVKLAVERLTGNTQDTPVTQAMQWGIDHEARARELYEAETGNFVDLVGFIKHPSIPWLGASPDGLVGADGLVEIKCPTSGRHYERLSAGVVPEEYRPQMTVQLLVTGRRWCDYVDYDPRYQRPELRLFIRRFAPTAQELADAERLCVAFLAEVENAVNGINSKY